ncbi:DUF5994 family protein [Streptomyces griseofuscus]|uniref:DUF5994 family protein n=1 Tax=Streptomyces griseofuscus TaxID=146922 RepID=UPI00118AA8CC|nr:hypothetical protein SRO_1931 [Streptomyces rochei]
MTAIPFTPAVGGRIPSSSPLRLTLAPAGAPPALIDGAWWPRSRNLTEQLPALVEYLDPLWGRITRIAVSRAFWPVIPGAVPAHGHMVRVGWSHAGQDPHTLLLLSHTFGRWDLLVIPPETAPATAARLMATATDPSRSLTATRLIHGPNVSGPRQRQRPTRTRSGRRSGTPKADTTPATPPHALLTDRSPVTGPPRQ